MSCFRSTAALLWIAVARPLRGTRRSDRGDAHQSSTQSPFRWPCLRCKRPAGECVECGWE
jgi:hypothetical protein